VTLPIQPKQVASSILTTDATKAAPGTPYSGIGERIANVADPVKVATPSTGFRRTCWTRSRLLPTMSP
jgi:hypothetical protein